MRLIKLGVCVAALTCLSLADADGLAAADADHLTHGCAPFAVALRLAMAQYGEAAAFIAATGNGVVITLTVNAKTGTWTMWGQREPETMCLVTGGEGWEPAPDAVKQIAPAGEPS
jgi:hypothetical protein